MSSQRNLVIQSEPVGAVFAALMQSAASIDPCGTRSLARLGATSLTFPARGGRVFAGYLDCDPVVLGAFTPTPDGGVEMAVAMLAPHRSAKTLRGAMVDHLEDVAHLEGYRAAISIATLPDHWLGVASFTALSHVAHP